MSIPLRVPANPPPSNLRIRVFLPVFALACAVSLAWVFAREPVYVSTARLKVEVSKEQGGGKDVEKAPSLVNAAQALTGSTVLDQLRSYLPPGQAGADALRGMLSAAPIPDTNVIELRAEGGDRELLARLLGGWIDAYRRTQSDDFDRGSAAALEEARDVLAQLKQDVVARRNDVEQFRKKYDIVSMERDDNQAIVRLRNLNQAMNEARNREVNAAARLAAMRENLAAGKPVPGVDGSGIQELEKSATTLRERMRELEQQFTAHYLGAEPNYKAMRTSLARIERQLGEEKRASVARALEKEEQEIQSSRQTVVRLQEELTGRKREVQDFTTRVSEGTLLTNALARVEKAHETAAERVAQLELRKKGARPALTVLNLPTVPGRADHPDYWRDAAIAVGGAGVLGFLAVWFVEFFKRSGVPRPDPAAQPIIHISFPPGVMGDSSMRVIGGTAVPALGGSAARLPEAIAPYARELSDPEVRALWTAAVPQARMVIAGLLGGMSLEEIAALRYEHVDFDANHVLVSSLSGRSCALRDPLRRLLLERRAARGGEAPLADARGKPLTVADLDGLIACAAHDAGLADAGEIASETLRHTYFAYLVRQGARLAEIGEFIGRMPPAAYREYGLLSPPGRGLPLEDIDPVHLALRDLQQ